MLIHIFTYVKYILILVTGIDILKKNLFLNKRLRNIFFTFTRTYNVYMYCEIKSQFPDLNLAIGRSNNYRV